MAGILSKGLKLGYKATAQATSYTDLTNLLECPALGGKADSVEVTTLSDVAHTYISGLLDFGDSLDFRFLFDETQFTTLKGLTGSKDWQVSIPLSGNTFKTVQFSGECSVEFSGGTPNEAMEYVLSIKPNSAMTWA